MVEERCREIASKYTSRKEFNKNDVNIYNICVKHGWLDEICSHMTYKKYRPKGYWDKERCRAESLKYKTRMDFKRGSGSAYSYSVKNKWLNEFFK